MGNTKPSCETPSASRPANSSTPAGPGESRSAARLYLTLDVEPDYARTNSYSILDKVAAFFDWRRAEQVPITAFVVGQLFAEGHRVIDRFLEASVPLGLHGFDHDSRKWGTMHTDHTDDIDKAVAA